MEGEFACKAPYKVVGDIVKSEWHLKEDEQHG